MDGFSLGYENATSNRLRLRKSLAAQQNFKCFYCGCPVAYYKDLPDCEKGRTLTLEHYVPKSKGGKDNIKDCVVSCRTCDKEKGDMHGDDYVALLRTVRGR